MIEVLFGLYTSPCQTYMAFIIMKSSIRHWLPLNLCAAAIDETSVLVCSYDAASGIEKAVDTEAQLHVDMKF